MLDEELEVTVDKDAEEAVDEGTRVIVDDEEEEIEETGEE